MESFLLRHSLVFLLLVSLSATSHARVLKTHVKVMKRCDFNSIYSFGEGSSTVSNGLVLNHPRKNTDFESGASFASPGAATVISPGFFIRNKIQQRLNIENSLPSQIKNFEDLFGARLMMPYEKRVKELQGALFFINQPGFSDYKQAFSQGKSIRGVSRLVPEVVSAIKNQITRFILTGASNVLVSGVARLESLPEFRRLLRNPRWLNTFGLLHNDHLQQALVELKFEFPKVHIVYGDYYKMNEKGFSQLAIEFTRTRTRSCDYFHVGDFSYQQKAMVN